MNLIKNHKSIKTSNNNIKIAYDTENNIIGFKTFGNNQNNSFTITLLTIPHEIYQIYIKSYLVEGTVKMIITNDFINLHEPINYNSIQVNNYCFTSISNKTNIVFYMSDITEFYIYFLYVIPNKELLKGYFEPYKYFSQSDIEYNEGIQGISGSSGDIGFQGLNGKQGHNGFQGIHGQNGFQGNQGFQGNIGSQGLWGYKGIKGYNANNGHIGTNGHQGCIGIKGFQGNQGFIGIQGFQGMMGLPGKSSTLNIITKNNINDTFINNTVNKINNIINNSKIPFNYQILENIVTLNIKKINIRTNNNTIIFELPDELHTTINYFIFLIEKNKKIITTYIKIEKDITLFLPINKDTMILPIITIPEQIITYMKN